MMDEAVNRRRATFLDRLERKMKIYTLGLIAIASIALACGVVKQPGAQGTAPAAPPVSGKTVTRDLSGYKKIKAENAIVLNISAQQPYKLTIHADESEIANVLTEVDDDTLVIKLKDNATGKSKIEVTIALPELTGVELTGATKAEIASAKTDELEIKAVGASTAKVDGAVSSLKVKAIGASTVDTEDLKADKADVESTGASSVVVSVTNKLKAKAVGASSVTYIGDPKDFEQDASDVSSIKKK